MQICRSGRECSKNALCSPFARSIVYIQNAVRNPAFWWKRELSKWREWKPYFSRICIHRNDVWVHRNSVQIAWTARSPICRVGGESVRRISAAIRRLPSLFRAVRYRELTKWHIVRPFKNLEVSIWKSRFLFTCSPSRKFNRRIIFARRILLRIQMVACRVLSIQLLAAQPFHSCYNLLWFEIDLISRSSFWTLMLIAFHLSLFIFVHLPLFIPLAIHLSPLSLVCHSC